MVHSLLPNRRRHYGPSSTWQRHDDRGSPSSNTNSQESLRALAKRYGINQKTVIKWKGRTSVTDVPTGPRNPLWARGYWVATSGNVTDEMWVEYFKNQTPPEPDDNFNVT